MDRASEQVLNLEAEQLRFLWGVDPQAVLTRYGRLVHQQARVNYTTLMRAGVTIDYEDVYQEGLIALHRAIQKYDPLKATKAGKQPPKTKNGYSFTTYLTWTIYFELRRWAEKMIEEKVKHGVVNVEDMGDSGCDVLETIVSEGASPEQVLEAKQEFRWRMRQLTPVARRAAAMFLRPSRVMCQKHGIEFSNRTARIPLTEICVELKLSSAQATKVRKEIMEMANLVSG